MFFDKPLCGVLQSTNYGIQAANGSGWLCMGERCYFLVFVPTIREIRDFYREM
eukprot:SAG31_NODE_8437_length_1452_cov_2.221729_2_plen_53_part_00